ncbi:MAG TPA: ThuA domain-containing protein [Anaerolineales bacterium]|nr:ThuA domain-containing protein [Anaerolineales bacterium]HRF47891.1 ThuA domain-containing protein [Anaerolineales bacterium]
MSEALRVTVWNEGRHEKRNPVVAKVYPNGLHHAIAEGLRAHGFQQVRTATLDEPEHGLTESVLTETDVLLWWGHMAHGDVQDEIVERVAARVLDGMGLVVLHSGHFAKVFKRLMGTTCNLKWREHERENERLWVVAPAHPIAAGLPQYIDLANEEMYGEHFDIPAPDELVLVSWFKGGEVFRSGCCWQRGRGRIFYFRPGHETFPTYHNELVRQVIANGVRWAAPVGAAAPYYGNYKPLEPLD